jgi:hypothetical protein
MLSQLRLIEVLDADLRLCDEANPADEPGQLQKMFVHDTLLKHREWASEAGDDQTVLEQIVRSLERNMLLSFQRWREESTV